jgi:rubrerythrin
MEQAQTSRPTTILSDCQYNIVKQLEKKMQFLWGVDGYINDAEKEGNKKCVETFRKIKADEERHAGMLKELLSEYHKRAERV